MMMMLVDRKNVFKTILCVTLLSLCFDGGGGVALERIQSDSSGGGGVYHHYHHHQSINLIRSHTK